MKSYGHNEFKRYMNTGVKKIHPTQIIFGFWPEFLFQYFNELPLGGSI